MATNSPLDELRSTLLSRMQPQQQQPPAPAQPPQNPMYQLSGGLSSKVVEGGDAPVLGMGDSKEPYSSKMPVPLDILEKLRAAAGGATGAGGAPQTGMTPPTWPPTPMPMGPAEIPIGMPNAQAKVPPRVQRFETAQKMQDGYRNNWNPNPMLIRVLQGR